MAANGVIYQQVLLGNSSLLDIQIAPVQQQYGTLIKPIGTVTSYAPFQQETALYGNAFTTYTTAFAPPPQPTAVAAPLLEDPAELGDPSLSLHMEKVWNGNFYKAFSQFPHRWYLTPTLHPVEEADWNVFQDSAKVRFICNSCGRAWTSMKGRCTFWYKFHFDAGAGVVLFKLYGQRCQHCNLDDKFEHAMWYPREVIKVISNIFLKVGETYYNFTNTQLRVDRRAGKPQHRHNKDLCQACHDGICKNDYREIENDDSRMN